MTKFVFAFLLCFTCASIGSCQPLTHKEPPSFYKFDDLVFDDLWVYDATPETIHDSIKTTTVDPMTTTTEPLTTTKEPSKITEAPTTTIEKPTTTTGEPTTATEEPMTTTEETTTKKSKSKITGAIQRLTRIIVDLKSENHQFIALINNLARKIKERNVVEPTGNPSNGKMTTKKPRSKFVNGIQTLAKHIIYLKSEKHSALSVIKALSTKIKGRKRIQPTKEPSSNKKTTTIKNPRSKIASAFNNLFMDMKSLKSDNHAIMNVVKTLVWKMKRTDMKLKNLEKKKSV